MRRRVAKRLAISLLALELGDTPLFRTGDPYARLAITAVYDALVQLVTGHDQGARDAAAGDYRLQEGMRGSTYYSAVYARAEARDALMFLLDGAYRPGSRARELLEAVGAKDPAGTCLMLLQVFQWCMHCDLEWCENAAEVFTSADRARVGDQAMIARRYEENTEKTI